MPKEEKKSVASGVRVQDAEGNIVPPPETSGVKSGDGLKVKSVNAANRTVIADGKGGSIKVVCPGNSELPKEGDTINARLRLNSKGEAVSAILK